MDEYKPKSDFHPILMHFAARYAGYTYGEFASDYKVLVDSNLKCLADFGMDAVGLISDPYRETAAFGAKIDFPAEGVPRCKEILVRSRNDIDLLKSPDVYGSERTLDRIKGGELLRKQVGSSVPVFGWIEGPLAESCDLAGVNEILLKLFMEPDIVDIDWMVDMEEAFDKLGDEIIRCGNLDPVAVIQDREAKEIRLDAEDLCRRENGRPFILSGGCEITVNTHVDHLKAMREASQ